MVWLCDSCGHGNLDIFLKCINCEKKRKISDEDLMSCWDFFSCKEEYRSKCVVYNTDNGIECFLYPRVLRKCKDRDYNSCSECKWYKELHKK
jgi:hypothetical protein